MALTQTPISSQARVLARRAGCSRSWSAVAVSRAAVPAMILGTAEEARPLHPV